MRVRWKTACLLMGFLNILALCALAEGKPEGAGEISYAQQAAWKEADSLQNERDSAERALAGQGFTKEQNEREQGAAAGQTAETKRIALTFDDGPNPRYTEELLEGLRERQVHVTFFVLGQSAEQYPDLIREMAQDGHLIGNHTYSHMQLTPSNGECFAEELQKTDALIYELTGMHTEFVRPPYGVWDHAFEESLNMIPVLWTIDPQDWCCTDVGTVISRAVGKAQENGIILLHDVYGSSVQAALGIIDELSAQGYEFVTVDEIIMD